MDRPAPASAASSGRRVLIIDDDRDFSDSLRNLLALEGYDVETAYSLAGAFDALDRFAAEVALIDIRLGDRDGLTLVTEFRQRRSNIICVIMTAYASVESAIHALQEGACDFLCKPFYPEDLIATLERCFERIALARGREEAERALRMRNQELEAINARLERVVTSMQSLSTCATLQALYTTAVEVLAYNMDARNAALYLVDGEELVLHQALHPGLPARMPFPDGLYAFKRPVYVLEQEADLVSLSGPERPLAPATAAPTSLLGFPLNGEGYLPIGLFVVQADADTVASKREREFGMIVASFANETVRLLHALDGARWNEARLREIIDNSPSLITLNDMKGRFLVVNRQFEAWHGRAAADVVGKTPSEVFSPDIARLYDSRALATLLEGKIVEEEVELGFHDGSAHIVLVTRFPVRDALHRCIGVGTITTDVTDRRRVEERLRHAQKMEALGQLTGGIAHDFSNLLAVINGNLDLLRESLDGRPDDRELIDDCLSSAASGRELIQQLLAFGRRQRLNPEPIDPNDIITSLLRVLKRTLGGAIEVRWVPNKNLWPIAVDKSQFETSLLNLVLNARDAMPQGGLLTIETENEVVDHPRIVEREAIAPGCYVTLSVADIGAGMTPAVAAQAIHPFFTTKETGSGSGLGLSMVYGFVKQSGGCLVIDSKPGEGTAVTLYFPRAEEERAQAERTKEEEGGARAKCERILVVEDKPAVRKMAKTMLTTLGYSILDAEDGSTALTLLQETANIDLLLTDILLTGQMNGFDLAKEARRYRPELKVLFMSGYADFPDLLGEDPGDDLLILEKPFTKEAFARKVRQALPDAS